jgi:hypothetical protein
VLGAVLLLAREVQLTASTEQAWLCLVAWPRPRLALVGERISSI